MSPQPLNATFLMKGDDGNLYRVSLQGVEPMLLPEGDPDMQYSGLMEQVFEEVKQVAADSCVVMIRQPRSHDEMHRSRTKRST